MPLSVGDKLGPYEILPLIGKGGMGEVWKAHDPRLSRDIAIKVSAAQFSARFELEAKAIAALNGTDFGGRALTINEAKPKSDRPRGGGQRFGGGGGRGHDDYRGHPRQPREPRW